MRAYQSAHCSIRLDVVEIISVRVPSDKFRCHGTRERCRVVRGELKGSSLPVPYHPPRRRLGVARQNPRLRSSRANPFNALALLSLLFLCPLADPWTNRWSMHPAHRLGRKMKAGRKCWRQATRSTERSHPVTSSRAGNDLEALIWRALAPRAEYTRPA